MAASKRSSRSSSPLDARRRALHEAEEKIRKQREVAQRRIDDAPKIKEQQEKRRREELLTRSVKTPRRVDEPRLLDKRFDVSFAGAVAPRRRRPLKMEQRQARITFCGLLVGLLLLLLWLYSVWHW